MNPSELLLLASTTSAALLALALFFIVIRFFRGPTLPDRIMALDSMTNLGIGFIGIFAIRSGLTVYLDLAIALSLVGFLSTLALARFLLLRPRRPVHGSLPGQHR